MFKVRYNVLLFVCGLLISSCGSDNLPKYVELGDLRILAIVADTPEVQPLGNVTLTPYVSDMNGNGRILTYSAAACVDPGIAYGATPDCTDSSTHLQIAEAQTLSTLSSPNYTGAGDSITLTVPDTDTLFLGKSEVEMQNGIAYLLTYTIESSDGESVSSFKRIVVSTKEESNQNPAILRIVDSNLGELESLPSEKTTYKPEFDPESNETYIQFFEDGTFQQKTETLTTTWFISDGGLDRYRTENSGTNEYTPPGSPPTDRNAILFFVTRDGRGGTSVLQIAL